MRVVFPAPDGDETMKRSPRGIFSSLLHVLDLLLERFDLRLQVEDVPERAGLANFLARGVRLAVELLREEVEAFPDGPAGVEQTADLDEVRLEPLDLLRDVGAVSEHR